MILAAIGFIKRKSGGQAHLPDLETPELLDCFPLKA
jgi:hypothetical protein